MYGNTSLHLVDLFMVHVGEYIICGFYGNGLRVYEELLFVVAFVNWFLLVKNMTIHD